MIQDKIWNPVGFFISLFMSLIMPLIFAVLGGYMDLYTFLSYAIIRWPIAYFIVNLVVIPISLKLAFKFFTMPPKNRLFNPVAFFISFFMSFIMPFLLAYILGSMPLEGLIYGWPLRWLVAYILVNLAIRPISIKCAIKVFNYEPQF